MHVIVQLSDLHFGKTNDEVVTALVSLVQVLKPNLVVVSGDLTYRARGEEFAEALNFLQKLPVPQVVIPGNHDISLYNLWKRFIKPNELFRKIISDSLEPFYQDDYVSVLGLNTSFPLLGKGGMIRKKQLQIIEEKFTLLDSNILKIVLTHHPLDKIWSMKKGMPLYSKESISIGLKNKVDIFMSGHLHKSQISIVKEANATGYNGVLLKAGTATSVRYRGEVNSFNAVFVSMESVFIQRYSWNESGQFFDKTHSQVFSRNKFGLHMVKG